MQGANFISFIIDELGWSYYIDASGIVQKQFLPRPLQTVPANFEEMELAWGRSELYAGLQQSYTVGGQFVQDAAKIIKQIVYTKGSEGVIKWRIYKLNKQFGAGMKQELFYESDFDLSKYDRQTDYINAILTEGGAEKLLKAFEGTDFEIDVTDDPDAVDLLADGIIFKNTFNYSIPPFDNNDGLADPFVIPVVYLGRDGITDPSILSSSTSYQLMLITGLGITQPFDSTWFFKVQAPSLFTYRIKGTFKFKNNGPNVRTNVISLRTHSTGTFPFLDILYQTPATSIAVGETHEVSYDETITTSIVSLKDHNIYWTAASGIDTDFEFLESKFEITFDYRYKFKIVKALTLQTLMQRLFAKIFGYTPNITSTALLTANEDLLFLCGDAVRNLAGSKIKTSWQKLFKFIHMRNCAGFDLLKDVDGKGVVVLDYRANFYQDIEVLNVGTVANPTDKFAESLFFNEIIIGYPDQDYGEVNGRGEFNVTQKYTTPLTRSVKQLDLQTQYRADMLGFEITRINLQNKTTTDSNSDNDVFVVVRELTPTTDILYSPDPYYKLDRSCNASATGLIEATSAFNLKLSPKTCLLNHGWYLRSCLFYHAADKITYQTSDKNAALVYTNGATITERADISIGLLPAPLFSPHELSITAASGDNVATVLTPKPKGYVSYTTNRGVFKGFILDAKIRPVTEEEQTWKLLSKADNDLTRLI